MADENKPAFYPRVGNIKAKNFKPAKPMPFIDDERAMDLPQYGDIDLSQPTKANLEMGRRMAERDAQLRRQAEADRSPLEKLAGGVQAGRFLGSALTQAINSAPTRLFKGDEAADKFMQERMYKPEQPLAYEYAGDVGDFLEKLETQYKIPPVLPEAVALQYLAGPATSQAMRTAGRGAEQAGMAVERGMEPVVRGALERGGLPREMAMAMGANTQSNVIKRKGGNWLTGSVEKSLEPLKRNPTAAKSLNEMRTVYPPDVLEFMSPETRGTVERAFPHLEKEVALNNWVDRNLANYVKKEMATPEDPVRNLIDQGISHLPQDALDRGTWLSENMEAIRRSEGFPGAGMANTEMGRGWENLADEAIQITAPAVANEEMLKANPWLSKLEPDESVYRSRARDTEELGFDHIMDVLRQDVESGRIRPEQLNKVSIEQAVRRTYEYDQEMARKARETALQQQEGFPVQKEYPQGYKWLDLSVPKPDINKPLPEGFRWLEPKNGYQRLEGPSADDPNRIRTYLGDTKEQALDVAYARSSLGAKNEKILEDALKYEGNTMGHCVGGYCPDVLSGRTKIYSLRDAKGEPHVTIEVRPQNEKGYYNSLDSEARKDLLNKATEYRRQIDPNWNEASNSTERAELLRDYLTAQNVEIPSEIVQIKGKGNAKPKDDYLPFVQDFVRSGNWSNVGDFKNTGLYTPKQIVGEATLKTLQDQGVKIPKYLTQSEADDFMLQAIEAMGKQKPLSDLGGMKRGGVVISKNPDAMMLELNEQKMKNGVPAYAGGKAVTKMGLKAAASEAERALPLRLTRAMPKPLSEINAHAERVARQMMGEHVTSGKAGDTKNLAGRSMKESQRVKGLEYELVPTKDVPESQVVEAKLGDINVALPGDFTVSDVELKSLMGEPIGSRQEGGSRYGLGHLEDELPLFYASNEGPAQQVQNKVTELAELYGPERVMGHHMAMGPIATNFAQHFADANLRRIDYSKLRPADMYQFDKILSEGFVLPKKDKKTGQTTYKVVDFPDWPGIVDPQAAYFAMKQNPEMRKWFNKLMQTPKITEPLGLPNAQDVRYAITSPDLRDMEVNLTGHGVGELVPNAELTDTANHNTYLKGIRGIYKGHQDVLSPFPIAFADAAQHIISTQRPQDFTGTIQKVFPHQIVDQQYLDEMGAYRKRLKELTGKKEGGAIKQPAAYIDGNEFVLAAKKYGIKDSMNNLNKIVDLVNKGLSVDDAARQVADTGMHKADGGAITGDDLIIEERPL